MRKTGHERANRLVGILMVAAFLALACEEGKPTVDAAATMLDAPATDGESDREGNPELNGTTEDPLRVFGLSEPVDAVATTVTPVWLVNDSEELLIVSASGGAAKVIVDTVSASDSVFVRVETPADTVVLSARTTRGTSMGQVGLPMDTETKRAVFPQ